MIKAVLFDADGMLIKAKPWSITFCRKYRVPYKKVLPFFKNEFQLCLVGKADLKKEIIPYLKKWGWKKSPDSFLKSWFESEYKVDKKIISVIKGLRKKVIKCCLATNQEKYRINFMNKQMGFRKIFDKIFYSAEIGYKKPDPKFFQFVIKDLKFKKKEIQYWDDSLDYVKTASIYGLEAHHYSTFKNFYRKTVNSTLRMKYSKIG